MPLFTACAAILLAATDPAPLQYATSWLGNSFGGGPDWVQNFAEGLVVRPDGTCVVTSFWDEAGREVGFYKNGKPGAHLKHTHMRGGKAVAVTDKYVFYAHTSAREDQPPVPAGEAPKEKAVCRFGVSRWTHDGEPSKFPGGVSRYGNMAEFRQGPDDHDQIPCGLTTDGKLLYVADTTAGRVRVLDVETLKPVRDFAADKPEALALDPVGNLWAIRSGGKAVDCYSPAGERLDRAVPLPAETIVAGLSFDPAGRLVVCDNGPRQQLLFFDLSASPAKLADTFGEAGGVFAGPHPGRVGPFRLPGPTGAGFDAAGNLYVACNPGRGCVLRAFDRDRRLKWELTGLEFVDVADAAPGSDGLDVFTAGNRYRYDPAAPPGKGWTWTARHFDPFAHPDDLRRHVPVLQCGTSVRVLGGKTFLCQRGMWQGVLGFYRLDGDRTVPAAVLSVGPIKAEKGDWKPAGQPEAGRWLWRDANGNGRFDPGEYTPTTGPDGEYWASNVDAAGDIWQAGQNTGIWRWRFLGLDAHGNPKHDPKPDHRRMPAPFRELLRTEYDPATDTMYLTGDTKERPVTDGWGSAGTTLVRYDGWSKSPAVRYRIDLPFEHQKRETASVHVAGGLVFAVECKTAQVHVWDAATGRRLGSLKPGPEVHRESGWIDFRDAIRAVRRADGSYLVFVEEDWKGKVLVYHLADPLVASQPATPTSPKR